MKMFIILFRYQIEGEKKPGPVRQFRIYARDIAEAQHEAKRYGNYPNLQILDVKLGTV